MALWAGWWLYSLSREMKPLSLFIAPSFLRTLCSKGMRQTKGRIDDYPGLLVSTSYLNTERSFKIDKVLKSNEKMIAGIDDATKCPCIGSIFISGVAAHAKTINEWKDLGVKDSKLLTRKKRDELEKIIKETSRVFEVAHIPPCDIDDKSCNLNEWEMINCLRIIKKIYQPDLEEIYDEKYTVVGAASILSKGDDSICRREILKLRKESKRIIPEENLIEDNTYVVEGLKETAV